MELVGGRQNDAVRAGAVEGLFRVSNHGTPSAAAWSRAPGEGVGDPGQPGVRIGQDATDMGAADQPAPATRMRTGGRPDGLAVIGSRFLFLSRALFLFLVLAPACSRPGRRPAGRPVTRRHAGRPGGAALGGGAEGRVGGAVAGIVAAPLDDLEEQAFAEGAPVELEEFPAPVAVIHDAAGLQARQQVRVEAETGVEVVIVVRADVEHREAAFGQCGGGGEDVVGGEGDVLHGRPKLSEMKRPAWVQLNSAPFSVTRRAPAVSIAWLRTRPSGSATSTIGAFAASKIAV